MNIKFVHTNIVSSDWKKLADFYINVFECIPILPERNLSGNWLDKGTGLKNASLTGVHLRLPGYGKNGPEQILKTRTNYSEKSVKWIVGIPFRETTLKSQLEKSKKWNKNRELKA